jgi:hypothetical protein
MPDTVESGSASSSGFVGDRLQTVAVSDARAKASSFTSAGRRTFTHTRVSLANLTSTVVHPLVRPGRVSFKWTSNRWGWRSAGARLAPLSKRLGSSARPANASASPSGANECES